MIFEIKKMEENAVAPYFKNGYIISDRLFFSIGQQFELPPIYEEDSV